MLSRVFYLTRSILTIVVQTLLMQQKNAIFHVLLEMQQNAQLVKHVILTQLVVAAIHSFVVLRGMMHQANAMNHVRLD